jgi:zinc protease
MLYKTILFTLSLALLFSCTPKTADQMGTTPSTKPPVAATPGGKAPVIPMPGGNVRAMAPKAGEAPQIQIGKAETFQLDNGLTVIVVENHKLPTASYRIFVDNDPVLEKDAAGYTGIMGELLSKGTKNRTKAQIDEEIDFIGASLSSSPNGLSASGLSKHSDKMLEILSDVLLNPVFPAEELDKIKRRQESNLAANKDDANAIASNVASVLRYGKTHPYGEVMTEESLAKINLEQIRQHYNTYFKPNISYFVVVGDVSRAKVEQMAKQYFGKWQRGEVPQHNHGLPRPPEKTQVDFVHKPAAVQSVINITYPVELRPGDADVIRARLMNTLFGGYFNSRLNANLREGHGWTYGARSSLNSDKLIGAFTAFASVRNAVTDSSIIEFMKEMEKIRTMKVDAAELQVVKNVLTGQFSASLEEPGTVASFALDKARYNLPADYFEKYLATLQNVTPEEVMAMAQKYVRPDRAHILVVGNKEEVADRLKQFAPNGKVNFYDIYGNPLQENTLKVAPGITAQTVIEDYVKAIGGKQKLAALRDLQSTSVMKTRGPEFVIKTWQKGGSRIAIEMTMNGQMMSKRVYDGATGSEAGMGGATRTLEAEELADMKEQAMFAKETGYLTGGYKLTLKGAEPLEGRNAYVLEVERPDGKKTTEYYDMGTSLKIREVSSQPGPDGNPAAVITDFSDYKEVNGVMIPHTINLTGVFPVPVKATVTEIKANAGVDEAVFKLK